ncbi:MAG: cysteine synthase A [Candidatus Geothermarchaeales archaeon]
MRYNESIVDVIGQTPMVRLRRVVGDIEATVLAKLEFVNPGGSVKDRIGVAMIDEAEKRNLIHAGSTIVEPTSGNTGIGLAIVAAIRGYRMVFTIPDKMSREKIDQLKAYGAEIVVAPTDVPSDDPRNFYQTALKIARETPNSYMPNQYRNPANPKTHYETTGPEIWEQTEGRIDVLVVGMGTGGTATGAARFLKEKKDVTVVGVDPEGSMFHHEFYQTEEETHAYKTEGIGEDFMPETLDLGVVDRVVTVTDRDAFLMARRLAREEGLLVGSSSGAAVHATLEVARDLDKEKTVVVILPDTGKNYLSTLYSDEWMREQGFIE